VIPPGPLSATGVTVPDITGTYLYAGEHEGRPYWKHETLEWCTWYSSADLFYHLTPTLGVIPGPGNPHWKAESDELPDSDYQPFGTAEGWATFAFA